MPSFADFLFDTGLAIQNLAESLSGRPLRLGVTGLSGAGKTIFLTALVQHLTLAARVATLGGKNPLPVFRVHAEGRLVRGAIQPQPDDAVPRFAYEDHIATLTGPGGDADKRAWPESTRRISELRLTLEFERDTGFGRRTSQLTIDLIDYPGEWLLDLPLLGKSYQRWSQDTLDASLTPARAPLAAEWRAYVTSLDAEAAADEGVAQKAAALFTAYLRACRAEPISASALPPGRFLMPGDLEGSPLLTFSPLPISEGSETDPQSLAGMMARRYDAYRNHVVRPFFRDHFARLDRQVVLVDVLAALNAGVSAVRDLEQALGDVLNAFRTGKNTLLTSLLRPRIDKILFAATKADHLNHVSHDRLEAILRRLTARAIARSENVGAIIDVVALAAVRATHEVNVGRGGAALPAVVGIPIAGERIGGEVFDGRTEAAIFPGELPRDPDAVFSGDMGIVDPHAADYRFVRFRPPIAARDAAGEALPLPHIRLDRALQFLLGDRFD
ncbi:MAG: YcjX family protein [Methylovirgula sp.]|uniref:YcjX family protein n=1 Tax=Methylovirgula sp. TaxID=1978224 RepID=UPI0030762001